MVIFANGIAIGDEPSIARTFESRRREHDALQQMENLLTDAIEQSGDGWQAFTVIDRRLDDPRTLTIRDSTAYRQARENVTLWMRLDPGDPDKASFRLQHTLGDVRARMALVKEHMLRR
jgi:hypothetical protein